MEIHMKNLLVILAIALFLAGCSRSQGTSKTLSTPALVKTTQSQLGDLGNHSQSLTKQVKALPDTLPQKSGLVQTSTDISNDSKNLQKSIGAVGTSASKDAATISAQKKELASNPLKSWLYLISGVLIALGISGFILTLFMTLPAIIRTLSIGALVTGACLGSVAYFLTAIFYVVGGIILSGLIGGGVWLWYHWKTIAVQAPVVKPATVVKS